MLGLPITENDTVSLLFGIDTNEILTFAGSTPQTIIDYIDAVGQRTFHAWRTEVGWARDTRNDFFMPTRGTYQRVSAEITLPGSTVEYYKLNYEFSKYWPHQSVAGPEHACGNRLRRQLRQRHRAQHLLHRADLSRPIRPPEYRRRATGTACRRRSDYVKTVTATGLPFFENFYAGGVRSVRGFRDNTLGPRSDRRRGLHGQPLGGAIKTTGSLEMYFPKLFDSKAARISAFVDFGNVFDGQRQFRCRRAAWLGRRGPVVARAGGPDFDQLRLSAAQEGRATKSSACSSPSAARSDHRHDAGPAPEKGPAPSGPFFYPGTAKTLNCAPVNTSPTPIKVTANELAERFGLSVHGDGTRRRARGCHPGRCWNRATRLPGQLALPQPACGQRCLHRGAACRKTPHPRPGRR